MMRGFKTRETSVREITHVSEQEIGASHNYSMSGVEGRTSQFHRRSVVTQRRGAQENLAYFEVPPGSIEPIRSKLAMKIFDEYTNVLKGMYSIRFNGRSDHGDTSTQVTEDPTTGTFHLSETQGEREKGRGIINICFMSRTLLAFR
jgi:hypothetical protein